MSTIGTPVEVAKYYGYPVDRLNGSGQHIGIVDLDNTFSKPTLLDDLATLGVKINPDNIKEASVGGAQHVSGGFGETQEDVEILASICPGATITVYNGDFGNIVGQAVKDGISVLSSSWGFGPDSVFKAKYGSLYDTYEAALEAAKKTGKITICVAAGDGGSSDTRGGPDLYPVAGPNNLAYPDYPASSPNVLAVGGTKSAQGQEVVWNNTPNGGATGGGVSTIFGVPSWQASAAKGIVSANDGTTTGRVVPDVAAFAGFRDYELVFNAAGSLQLNGGTSAATPMWSALITLTNQNRAAAHKGPLGWINDKLYSMAASQKLFIDITSGDNKSLPDYPGYNAGTGFDACSGLGAPVGAALIEALTALP